MLNSIFGKEAEKLAHAMRNRRVECRCITMKDPSEIVHEAYMLEPRLLAIVESLDMYTSKSNLMTTVTFMIHYRSGTIADLNDIIIDDGTWTPSLLPLSVLEYPGCIYMVSKCAETIPQRISNDPKFLDLFPGYIQAQAHSEYHTSPACQEYSFTLITIKMCLKEKEYIRAQRIARETAAHIIDSCLGGCRSKIPTVMKAFLAFSYLQQTVEYDSIAALAADSRISFPFSVMPYGPIVNHKGICAGIAAAYQMMMNIYGINCHIVFGDLKGTDGSWGPHAWNMIQVGSHWYHVDATINIKPDSEVYTESFMKPDKIALQDHRWDKTKYPSCISSLMGYGKIEELLENDNPAYSQIIPCYLNPRIFN